MIIVLDVVQENIALSLDIMAIICQQIENGKVLILSIREIIKKILLVNNHFTIGEFSILFSIEKSLSASSIIGNDCAR